MLNSEILEHIQTELRFPTVLTPTMTMDLAFKECIVALENRALFRANQITDMI